MRNKIIIKTTLLALLAVNSSAQSFQEYLTQSQNNYSTFKNTIDEQFLSYKKAYDESYKEYASEIEEKWPTIDVSTNHKWVEYSKDYNSKKSIDYAKEEISVEVIALSEKEAKEKIKKIVDEMVNYSVEDGIKNDILQNKILKKTEKTVKEENKTENKQKLISDILSTEEQNSIKEKLTTQKIVQEKYREKFIYKVNVKLPSDFLIKKAKLYQPIVNKQSSLTNIPAELIYAVIHSESSFNPMARSHIPAFGLMQIVPKSAGVDVYYYLYKKKKILSSTYLYNAQNNILVGSNYLHILYFKYLKNIKNPQSRMYCVIAAYNTGAGNVSKAFIGDTNISKAVIEINKMDSTQVYTHLMKKLPYNETKEYLHKVNDRVAAYNQLIKNAEL